MFCSCTWKFYNLAKLTTWLEQQEVAYLTFMATSWLPVPHPYNTLLSFLFQEDSCYNAFLYTKLGIPHRKQDACTYMTPLCTLPYPPISIFILILYKYLRLLSLHYPLFLSGMYKCNLEGKYYDHGSSDHTPELLTTKNFRSAKHQILQKKLKRSFSSKTIHNLCSHQPPSQENTSRSFGLTCSSTLSNTLNFHMPVFTEISSLSDKNLEETVPF